MNDIKLPPCECHKRGHLFNASSQCQWCHRMKKDLEYDGMVEEIVKLKAAVESLKRDRENLSDYVVAISQCAKNRKEAARWLYSMAEDRESASAKSRWPWLDKDDRLPEEDVEQLVQDNLQRLRERYKGVQP